MKYLIIYGSSGSGTGKTMDVVTTLKEHLDADFIDVSNYKLSFFDYTHSNKGDDFHGIAQQMACADCIIFATPVYWYAMSAQLKVFFDRLSDLITIRKPLGRQLEGKMLTFVATGHDELLPEGFHVPFKRTAEYFNMGYTEGVYICTNSKVFDPIRVHEKMIQFAESLL
ncbi:MAG: NAD(P)H-dependent oxidoreductase [Alphaproteobacteria bacterium]|jgi:multimeric flavodoxin WrbA|nr:NAD(P)H-dependent oxidoreductase [Alphaproteobacteria bacterium]